MGILEEITNTKKKEIQTGIKEKPVSELRKSHFFNREVPSLESALDIKGPAIITEFKRRSPSKGLINICSELTEVTKGYQASGASAVSVLTDMEYFGGHIRDLSATAQILEIPVLRKDFIIDEYQVIEAKSAGASAILLIGSIIDKNQSRLLTKLACDLGMSVLFEIHDLKDLDVMDPSIRIIGVNNRNLNTFNIDMENSVELLSQLPAESIKVAESGFSSPADVKKMHGYGYNAFLIGTLFMSSPDPAEKAKSFIAELKSQYINA